MRVLGYPPGMPQPVVLAQLARRLSLPAHALCVLRLLTKNQLSNAVPVLLSPIQPVYQSGRTSKLKLT